jgi:hypothetical protein
MSQRPLVGSGLGRRRPDTNSQIQVILMLNGFAAAGALFISRAVLKTLEISEQYWVGLQIFRATDPFASFLELIPGADRNITGDLTLADATLVIALVLFPLGVLGFGGRRR